MTAKRECPNRKIIARTALSKDHISNQVRYFNYNNSTWNAFPTPVPINWSLFSPGTFIPISVQFVRNPSTLTLTHSSISVNGTVSALGVTQTSTPMVQSDYLHVAFQLDTNGASTPPPYTVNTRNMNVVATPALATIAGTLVTLTGGTGTATIQATQAGNGTYSAATPVNQSFTISVPGAVSGQLYQGNFVRR